MFKAAEPIGLHTENGDERIVGGRPTEIQYRPYEVSIQYLYFDLHVCGGSIIKENAILTAAHCTSG